MGIEAFFAACIIIWLSIFLYILLMHISQRRISKNVARLFKVFESLRERE